MISVKQLSFSYTREPFIENMSFHVETGEIFGFLGPSGAGKTTLQKILTGLITNYRGSAVLNGTECRAHSRGFYEEIGVDFEYSTLYEKLTARQNLQFFGSLYKRSDRDPEDLLQSVGLLQDGGKKVTAFSKGMRSRLNFIKALLHDPAVLFLDEPTSGLDPTNSRIMKDLILREKQKGKTILLTTHNMQDAQELCDRVAFIADGSIKALDSPRALMMRQGAASVQYSYLDGAERFGSCPLPETGGDRLLLELLSSGRLRSIHSSEPTLNDIFIELTGRTLT